MGGADSGDDGGASGADDDGGSGDAVGTSAADCADSGGAGGASGGGGADGGGDEGGGVGSASGALPDGSFAPPAPDGFSDSLIPTHSPNCRTDKTSCPFYGSLMLPQVTGDGSRTYGRKAERKVTVRSLSCMPRSAEPNPPVDNRCMTHPYRRLLADVLAAGAPYPLALTGGCAVRAHGLVERLSQDLEFATESPEALEKIAADVGAALEERGWEVRALEAEPLAARLIAAEPGGSEECAYEEYEVDLYKEALWHPPVQTEYGLTLSLEDVVGTKVRALADRGLARDLVDVRAAADRWSRPELEELGRRHAPDTFDLTDLQTRLVGAELIDDREFSAYGLDGRAIGDLRRWAQEWADDIAERLMEMDIPEDE